MGELMRETRMSRRLVYQRLRDPVLRGQVTRPAAAGGAPLNTSIKIGKLRRITAEHLAQFIASLEDRAA